MMKRSRIQPEKISAHAKQLVYCISLEIYFSFYFKMLHVVHLQFLIIPAGIQLYNISLFEYYTLTDKVCFSQTYHSAFAWHRIVEAEILHIVPRVAFSSRTITGKYICLTVNVTVYDIL